MLLTLSAAARLNAIAADRVAAYPSFAPPGVVATAPTGPGAPAFSTAPPASDTSGAMAPAP
jgi:hypothetical protein